MREESELERKTPIEWEKGARRWLEESSARGSKIATGEEGELRSLWEGEGGLFNSLGLCGLAVSLTKHGCVRCSLRIPSHLTDGEGNWQAGAIAAAIDDVCAAAIMSIHGIINVSVQFDISFFSSAKFNEEVDMKGRVVSTNGSLTAVIVEVRKKPAGDLVAIGRQWMSTSRGKMITGNSSKL